jgi:hypothetical protein
MDSCLLILARRGGVFQRIPNVRTNFPDITVEKGIVIESGQVPVLATPELPASGIDPVLRGTAGALSILSIVPELVNQYNYYSAHPNASFFDYYIDQQMLQQGIRVVRPGDPPDWKDGT